MLDTTPRRYASIAAAATCRSWTRIHGVYTCACGYRTRDRGQLAPHWYLQALLTAPTAGVR